MAHNHQKVETYLWIALILTGSFAFIEVIAGGLSGSLALISDAAHMSTDSIALIISLLAIQISKKQADSKRTFGYYRFEIFAAIINAIILIVVAGYIFYQAYQRLFTAQSIESTPMLVVAVLGLIINLIAIKLLHKESLQSLNVRSAFLEAWADMLSTLGVIIAALVIHFTGWKMVDSLVAIGIGLWVLPRSWTLLKESINILLEGVPEGLELDEINKTLMNIPGVSEVHDLHVWALSSGKISLTAHLVIDSSKRTESLVLKTASDLIETKFNITHSTFQVEIEKCQNGKYEGQQIH